MYKHLLFVFLCSVFSSELIAAECSAVFPGSNYFASNGGTSIHSDNECNGGSCNAISGFSAISPLPTINANGQFSSNSLTGGTTYEHTSWALGNGAEITYSGNGTAILYFSSSVSIPKETEINKNGDSANVLIIVAGSLTIAKDSIINAYIYVAGATAIAKDVKFSGGISSVGALSADKDGEYEFDSNNISSIIGGDFCGNTSPVIPISCTADLPNIAFIDEFSVANNNWKTRNFDRSISNWPNESIYQSNNETQSVLWNIGNNKLSIMGSLSNSGANEYGMVYFDHADTGNTTSIDEYAIFYDVTANKTNTNNDLGIVFGYQNDSNYYMARWTKFGSTYSSNPNFPGEYRRLELIKVANGSASSLTHQDDFNITDPFNMGVVVNEHGIAICVNDSALLFQANEQPNLNTHGFYSFDNDIGVEVDNFEVRYIPDNTPQVLEPLAIYSFEQTDFSSGINDSGNNNFQGTNFGGAPTYDGKFCSAFDSNGTNDTNITDNAFATGVDLDDDVGTVGSISFWYKSNTSWDQGGYNGDGERILFDASVDLSSGSDKYFQLEIEDNGRLLFSFEDTADADRDVRESSGNIRLANTWYYITVTWDLSSNFFEIYVDGDRVAGASQSTNGAFKDLGPIVFGDNASTYSRNEHTDLPSQTSSNGFFDEIRIYDQVLSESDIEEAMLIEPSTCVEELNYCDTTFVDGLTSHNNTGTITFNNRATIFNNPDDTLAASRLDPTTNQNGGRSLTCDGFGFCSSSGTPTQPISDIGSFVTTSSSTNFTVGNNGLSCTIGEAASDDCTDQTGNEFNKVQVNNDGTLFFSTTHSEYRIKELIVNDRAVIYLSPGNYWIEQLNFNNDTQLIVQGNGQVNLYVNNSSNRFADRAKVNIGGDANNLFIYSYDDLRINNEVELKALVYSEQTLTLSARVNLTGAASAANLSVGDDSEIYYTCPSVAPVAIDHYQIIHDGTGLTCEAETVTIKACTNADTATCTEYTSTTTVDLFVDGPTNDITKTSIAFTGSITTNFQYTSVVEGGETVNLSLNNTSVVANNNLSCITAGVDSGCAMVFVDTGFRFYSDNETSIPNQISGKSSNIGFNNQKIYIQAVEKNTTTGVCQGVAFDDNIEFAAQCTNPNTCSELDIDRLIVDDVSIPTTNSAPNDYGIVDVGFNNTDTAEIILSYPEAGELTLSARYNIPVDGSPSGNLMVGGSTFVVRPFGFYIEVAGNPAAEDADGGAFIAADTEFDVTITAKAWEAGDDSNNDGIPDIGANLLNNTITENFTGHTAQIIHNIVAAGGNNKPDLSNNIFSAFSLGTQTQAISWGEVGILSFDVDLVDGTYLGAGNIQGNVPYVGRFYPAKFTLTSPMISPACNNIFTYMGEPKLDIAYSIKAQNSSGVLTENYSGDFVKSTLTLVAENNDDAVNRGNRLPLLTQNWVAGEYTNPVASLVTFQREVEPDGPFESLNIGLKLVDSDGASIEGANLRADKLGVCTNDPESPDTVTDCDAISLGATSVRYGRLVLQNAYGPETSNLLMPMQVEFLNSAGKYIVNTDDTCTVLNTDNDEVTFSEEGYTSLEPSALTSATADAGDIDLIELVAPNAVGNVTITMLAHAWLTFDWNTDGTLVNPSALATFGLYRGNDRIIQWREISP